MKPLHTPLPPLLSQNDRNASLKRNTSSRQKIGQRIGRFCEKILIVCCMTLFLALLVAALFNATAAEKNFATDAGTRFESKNEVKTLLLKAIRKQAWSGRYETGRLRLTLPADFPNKGRIAVRSVFWDEASRRFSAQVTIEKSYPFEKNDSENYNAPPQRLISLSGEATPYVRVIAARRTLLYGTRISRADLKTIELPKSRKLRSAITDTRQALGMEIRFRRKAGEVLRTQDLRPARLVKRRSTVRVAYEHEGVRVVLQALALDNGAHGETVRLRNRFSGREFLATVDGAGHASVISYASIDARADEQENFERKEGSQQRTKKEQNFVAENPFRANRQRRYDSLLNEPLSRRTRQ